MTTTPTLPPLPPKMVLRRVMPDDYRYGDVYGYTAGQMQAYALAAYQAGRDAGLEEAAIVGGHEAEKCLNFPDGQRVADAIRALKSDAKE